MVATRRGVRVLSPTKTNSEQLSEVQATPSTGRRTRSTAKVLVEFSSQPASPLTSSSKRCTRASRLHSPEQSSTPVGSVHEADTSDLESCCSAASDIELRKTRTRRRGQPLAESREDEELSEAGSCSSAVSASKAGQSSHRSTRRKPAPVEAEDVKVDLVPGTESGSSSASKSQRVTRSQRKTARTRSSVKQQTEDSDVSDAESCASSVSGVSQSAIRRSTRSRRQTSAIPIHLDETSEGSSSPAPTGRSSRAKRGKTSAAADVSEPPSCDSEGFESGPTYSMTTRRRGKTQSTGPNKGLDSDSDQADVQSSLGSPRSTRSRGTPCSSRTGSGNSNRNAPASRLSIKDLSIVLEKASEPTEGNSPLQDSRLESTLIAEDADCTLLEEDQSQMLEEPVNSTDLASNEASAPSSGPTEDEGSVQQKAANGEEEEDSHLSQPLPDDPSCVEAAEIGSEAAAEAEVVCEAAVLTRDQQEEPPAENKDNTSEVEMMQETATICERASENPEEAEEEEDAMEVADADVDADARPPQGEEPVAGENVMETQTNEEQRTEVQTLNSDVQQVVASNEVPVESIQVTSKQDHKITVDSESEPHPKDVIVQNTKIISLLVSSEDEDDEDDDDEEEEAREVSEEEEEEHLAEKRDGRSKKSAAAVESVEGLFMIDTRPGQAADEDYFNKRQEEEEEEEEEVVAGGSKEGVEQEEQDEEFVDEEEEDDDDVDAEILFSSRDPHSKELSSCIDPGIRMKELGGLYINFGGSKSKPVSSSLQKLKEKKIQDEVMKKSVIGPDFEKKDAVPPYSESKQAMKLKHRAEREKSTGDGWFNMKAPELTGELKGDLQVLKMRGSLDPKRFYKKNDRDGFPKYFQVGTVVDSAVDFYHSRVPKKERKRTMVEELLADAEFRHKNKKKYQQILMEKAAQGAGKRKKKNNNNNFRKK